MGQIRKAMPPRFRLELRLRASAFEIAEARHGTLVEGQFFGHPFDFSFGRYG